MAAIAKSMLCFPSYGGLLHYLRHHPKTHWKTNPWLTEKKVIESVAKTFADREEYPEMTRIRISNALFDMNLGLSQGALGGITKNLTEALIDCANGKPLAVYRLEYRNFPTEADLE